MQPVLDNSLRLDINLTETDQIYRTINCIWTEPQKQLTTQRLATDATEIILPESGVCQDDFIVQVAACSGNVAKRLATPRIQMSQQWGGHRVADGLAWPGAKHDRRCHSYLHKQMLIFSSDLATKQDISVMKVERSTSLMTRIWHEIHYCFWDLSAWRKRGPISNTEFCRKDK